MILMILLLGVTLLLPLAIKLGWIKGKIREQLEEDNRKVRPLIIFSLLYILPIAVLIVLVNYLKNDLVMPCMSPDDLKELTRLPLPDFCLPHWFDIIIIWLWSLANLITFKFYRRLKLEIFSIVAAAILGLLGAYHFHGALYGMFMDFFCLFIFRGLELILFRDFSDDGWSPKWRQLRKRFFFIEKGFKKMMKRLGAD